MVRSDRNSFDDVKLEVVLETAYKRRHAFHVTDLLKLLGPLLAFVCTLAYCLAAVYWVSELYFVQIKGVKVGVLFTTAANGKIEVMKGDAVERWIRHVATNHRDSL